MMVYCYQPNGAWLGCLPVLYIYIHTRFITYTQVEGKGDQCVHQEASTYMWASPVFATLDLGWESYNKDVGDRVLWMDDLVLSKEKIGCTAAAH